MGGHPRYPRDRPIRILYVDDEPSLLEVARIYLESKAGFDVHICNDPQKALTQIFDHPYDAIVSDYQMPVMDGIELLKNIRNGGIHTPFIIFTGRGREEVAINALNNGADFYVQKGGDVKAQFAELINSVRTCVSGHKARSDLRMTETSLMTMADNMKDPVLTLDGGRRILYANPCLTNIIGFELDQLIGKDFSNFVVNDEEAPFLETGKDELILKSKDGSLLWMEVTEAEIMQEGEIVDMLFLHDVTSKRMSEQSLADAHGKMVSMFDSITDPIYVSDMDDHEILYANKALLNLFDQDITGRKCYEVLQGKESPCDFCTNPIIREESNRPHIWEHHNTNLDHYYRVIDNVVKWPDGRDVRFEMTFDITDMKIAEMKAEETGRRFKAILNTIPDTLFTIDRDGIITDFKPRSASVGTLTREDAKGSDIRRLLGAEHSSIILKTMQKAFDSGMVETCHYSSEDESGPVHYTARLTRLDDDEVLAVISDVTAMRRTIEKLKESENLHRALFDNSPVAVKVHELHNLDVVYANPQALEYLGFEKPSDLVADGMPWAPSPFSKEEAMEKVLELLVKKNIEFDWLTARKDGSTFWERINLVVLPYEGRMRLLNFSSDITATKESFDELFRSQERYRALISSSNTGAWEYDNLNDVLWTSDEYFTMLGHDPKDFCEDGGRNARWLDLIHPEERGSADSVFRDYFNDPGDRTYENVFRLQRKDGSWSWILSRGKALKDNAGDYTGIVVGTHIDITPLREMEEKLKESNHRYRTLANIGKALVYTTDPEGNLTFVNDVVNDFTGISLKQRLQEGWMELIHPEEREIMRVRFESGISSRDPYTIKYRLKRFDGSYRWMIDEGIPRFDADGEYIGYIGHCMDVDDIIGLEKTLNLMNEKLKLMSSVTRHDILNQLVVLSGFIELSRDSVCSDDVLYNLNMMEKAVNAIQNLIEFTRDYEALGEREAEWQPFCAMIETSGKIAVEAVDEMQGLEILGDPLLHRAVHNLIDNAMRHGVEATRVVFDQRMTDEGSLIIGIEDDGIGILPEDKERIFLKGYGRNHGMGLFLIRQILSITGMTIEEVGEYGNGARFEITVPFESYRFRI